jgi:hypothetical protein
MNWINPKDKLPNDGDIVWVLVQHWKNAGPLSCEIYCGEVESSELGDCRVLNNDYIGQGGISWYLKQPCERAFGGEDAVAWAHVEREHLPDWLGEDAGQWRGWE